MVGCIPKVLTLRLTPILTYIYRCQMPDVMYVIYVIYVIYDIYDVYDTYDMHGALTYTMLINTQLNSSQLSKE